MSFDREALARAVCERGAVARIVVAATAGSVPREVGAAMLVWPGGSSGTIGGGALEHRAMADALEVLDSGRDRLERHPLGPALGQCCGGAVTLLIERWDSSRLDRQARGDVVARGDGAEPLAVSRLLARLRRGERPPGPQLIAGWMVEPVTRPQRKIWIWGAGHVGRALVAVLSPLPDLALTWIDTAPDRFPETLPDGVERLVAADPAALIPHAPATAEHLVLTFSHALDLEICHRLLGRGFGSLGLIGSATKWARFRARLRQLGHGEGQIGRIRCPIGMPELGKHPQAIAVGVAAGLLRERICEAAVKDVG